jgi:hypothetical protein
VALQVIREPFEKFDSPFLSVDALKHVIAGLFVLAEGASVAKRAAKWQTLVVLQSETGLHRYFSANFPK